MVIEREAPGGQAGTSSRIENYLGFPIGVSGDELASRALQQARRLGAEILVTRAVARHRPGSARRPPRRRRALRAATIILATGVAWRRLAIEGFDRLDRQGRLLRRLAQRGRLDPGAGHPPHRRRQLGRPGGAVLRQPRAQRDARRARRRAGEEHVALPDRAARARSQHRRRAADARWSRCTATRACEASTSSTRRPARRRRHDCGGLFVFIGADAETAGSRRRSRATSAATSSPGTTWSRPGAGAGARPVPARDERARHLRLRRRPLRSGEARRGRGRRGQHGDRLRAPVPAKPLERATAGVGFRQRRRQSSRGRSRRSSDRTWAAAASAHSSRARTVRKP